MTFKIGRPSLGGAKFDKNLHVDHLCVFVGPKLEERSTQFGDATAAIVDYVCCLDCPTVDADVVIFGVALVPALTDGDEEIVAGRLGLGEPKAGQNAPWLLFDPTDDDLVRVEQFLERNAVRTPSGRILVEIVVDSI
jgi:hypothetical protein